MGDINLSDGAMAAIGDTGDTIMPKMQGDFMTNLKECLNLTNSILKQVGSPTIQKMIKDKVGKFLPNQQQQVMQNSPQPKQQQQTMESMPVPKQITAEDIYDKIYNSLTLIKETKGDLTISQLLSDMEINKKSLIELLRNEAKP